jgi:hypothetical protein
MVLLLAGRRVYWLLAYGQAKMLSVYSQIVTLTDILAPLVSLTDVAFCVWILKNSTKLK